MSTLPESVAARVREIAGLADDAAAASSQFHKRSGQAGSPEEYERLIALRDAENTKRFSYGGLATSVQRFIETLRGGEIEVVHGPAIPDGVTIDDLRAELIELRRTRRTVQSSPAPRDENLAAAKKYVDDLVAKGAPRVSLDRGGLDVAFVAPDSQGFPVNIIGRYLAWLDPEKFLQRIESEIPETQGALSAEQRASTLKKLDARIFDAELQEVALVRASAGTVLPRPATRPEAWLGVRVTPKLKAVA